MLNFPFIYTSQRCTVEFAPRLTRRLGLCLVSEFRLDALPTTSCTQIIVCAWLDVGCLSHRLLDIFPGICESRDYLGESMLTDID